MVLTEFNSDLWTPIVERDISGMDRADRDSKRAGYPSTKKFFMEEFEKNEELVWIAKKELERTSGLVVSQLYNT